MALALARTVPGGATSATSVARRYRVRVANGGEMIHFMDDGGLL
jgi:hypothetical protein